MALVTAAGRLAVARADAPAEPLARLVLVDSTMNVVEIHDSVTPRRRSTSAFGRSCCERGKRGLDERDGIVRAEALGEDVVNAGRFAHGPHGRPGDHAGTGRGRHEDHVGRAVTALRPRAESSCRRAAR